MRIAAWYWISGVLLGCSGQGEAGGVGGGAGQPACTWCAARPPYARPCESTMIASGGQIVCVDDGAARLCEPATACGVDAGLRPRPGSGPMSPGG